MAYIEPQAGSTFEVDLPYTIKLHTIINVLQGTPVKVDGELRIEAPGNLTPTFHTQRMLYSIPDAIKAGLVQVVRQEKVAVSKTWGE
jgi:hypothetical protein